MSDTDDTENMPDRLQEKVGKRERKLLQKLARLKKIYKKIKREKCARLKKKYEEKKKKKLARLKKIYKKIKRELYKHRRSRAPTPPERRTFGQADADGERATTSSSSSTMGNIFSQEVSVVRVYSSGEEMLDESQAQQKQVETKGSNQVTTGNKKRKLKNQGSEPRSKKRNKSGGTDRQRDYGRQLNNDLSPRKNKDPRFKKEKETLRASKAQSTTLPATKSRQVNRDEEDLSVVEETPGTFRQSDTDELDEERARPKEKDKESKREVKLYKHRRATTCPERTFGQADADGERATTSSSSSKMLDESQAQQKQVETKGSNQVTTGNKKRKLKNQGSEPRSKKRKKDDKSVAIARRREYEQQYSFRKNKDPRFKKKKETLPVSETQSTMLPATSSRQASNNGDNVSSEDFLVVEVSSGDEQIERNSEVDEEDNFSSKDFSVVEVSSGDEQIERNSEVDEEDNVSSKDFSVVEVSSSDEQVERNSEVDEEDNVSSKDSDSDSD